MGPGTAPRWHVQPAGRRRPAHGQTHKKRPNPGSPRPPTCEHLCGCNSRCQGFLPSRLAARRGGKPANRIFMFRFWPGGPSGPRVGRRPGPSALGRRPADLALHAVSSVPPAGGNLNHRNLKNCNFNENKKRFSSLVFVLEEFRQSNQEMIGGK